MKLYDKGINNYNQTLTHVDKFQTGIEKQKCPLQCECYCQECSQIQDSYFKFYSQVLINRMYYSVFQLLKSYLVKKETHRVDHSGATGKSYESLIKKDKRFNEYANGIIGSMSQLREIRNKVDYESMIPTFGQLYDYREKIESVYEEIKLSCEGAEGC